MGTQIFLGKPPANIEQWIKDHHGPKLDEPLCFTAVDAGATVTLSTSSSFTTMPNLDISYDKRSWIDYEAGTTIHLDSVGDKVYMRARSDNYNAFMSGYCRISMTDGKRISASGNAATLLKNDGDLGGLALPQQCFQRLFENCHSLTTAPELPNAQLNYGCYQSMFLNCTGLIKGPSILPSEYVGAFSYASMFSGCTSLVEAPTIMLEEYNLNYSAYLGSMFCNCGSLTQLKMPNQYIYQLLQYASALEIPETDHGVAVECKDGTVIIAKPGGYYN